MMVVMTRDHISGGAVHSAAPGDARRPEPLMGAVLVVKNLSNAKTRLAATLPQRPTPEALREIVLAMLLDTLSAVELAGLDPIVVISPDSQVLRTVAATGHHMLRETSHPGTTLNHAYAQGARWVADRRPQISHVMMVQADLPAASCRSMTEVAAAAIAHSHSLVADASGTGTALLIRPTDDTSLPLFGPNSAAAHRSHGAVELDPDHQRWVDLRTDVDTADDLSEALALGIGAHTRSALDAHRATSAVTDGAAAPHPADAS